MLKPLPVTTSTFRDIIENGFLYVDKTRFLYDLIRYPKGVYFLARPRRFGKSLMISTLEEIFQGNRNLFQGLWINESDYKWERRPVIRIDFSRYPTENAAMLETNIQEHLKRVALQYEVQLEDGPFFLQLEKLILTLAREKQVIILIDEYDKPIIDNIDNLAEAERIRDTLKAFYTMIKSLDAYIHFVFITGISKFSRVGVFSSMNNLLDLTLSPRFATALGVTQGELESLFAEHSQALATKLAMTESDLLQQIRRWYDGFCFAEGGEHVYNPFSTLHLFYHQRFANYWFESGTPTFLIKLIRDRGYEVKQLSNLDVAEIDFSSYELENLAIVPLLFQTGYLTIKATYQQAEDLIYTLDYPNHEVEHAFITYLLSEFSSLERTYSRSYLNQLVAALRQRDFTTFFAVLDTFFANIDYDLHLKKEKYYQTIFYLIFLMLGMQVTAEVKTNQGRIDAVIELPDQIFLFEFKLDDSAEVALQQIKTTEYYKKYRLRSNTITLIGANFDSNQRKVTDWKTEEDTNA